MNWEHLSAFVWLRWRLLANQMRKGGTANAVIASVLAVLGGLCALALFGILLLVGMFAFKSAPSFAVLITWDAIAIVFLVSWLAGVLVELQRSEVLSFDKFLHLPVSVKGVFLINYVSSLASFTLLFFLPAMVGLILGLVYSKGPAMLLVLPLLAAFLLMVTALTYHFQGWIATIIVNKRKRGTIVALVTIGLIMVFQLPNLLNIMRPWKGGRADQAEAKLTAEEREKANKQALEYALHVGKIVNVALPPGWLALGAEGAAEGHVLPALLGMLGMGAIGSASLWRSYTTILRLYTGQFTSGRKRPAPAAASAAPAAGKTAVAPVLFFEKKLPWLSEPASAVALASFRSLLRAPEAKLMLLSPFITVVILGSLLLSKPGSIPEPARPLIGFAAMGFILVTMIQLVGNQFAFDRGGFRVYVLSGVPREDILLGKNLAMAPIILSMAVIVVVVVQAIAPMRFDLFLAFIPEATSMYLLFCLLANVLSILSPIPIAAGSLKPKNVRLIPILLHFAFFFLMPVVLGPAMLPFGIEFLLDKLADVRGLPICLFLSLIEVGLVALLYRFVVHWEGVYLQYSEQRILETVTSKTD